MRSSPVLASAQAAGRETDGQTDETDQTRPEPDRPTRPTPKHPYKRTDTVLTSWPLAPKPKKPTCEDVSMAYKKKVRVSCTSFGGVKNHRPLPPGAGQKPVPHLYPYSVGWEARRPLEPHGQPRRDGALRAKRMCGRKHKNRDQETRE